MSDPLDLDALRQWAAKRNIPYGSEMVRLFPRLCDDLAAAVARIEELEREADAA